MNATEIAAMIASILAAVVSVSCCVFVKMMVDEERYWRAQRQAPRSATLRRAR